jgi:hypothetical protein
VLPLGVSVCRGFFPLIESQPCCTRATLRIGVCGLDKALSSSFLTKYFALSLRSILLIAQHSNSLAAELGQHRDAIMKHYAAAMDVVKELQKFGQSRVQLIRATPHEPPMAEDAATIELYELGVELTALQHEKCVWPGPRTASPAHLFAPILNPT